MDRSFYRRYGLWFLLASLLTMPVALYALYAGVLGISNNPVEWLPPEFEETQRYFWYYDHFKGDEILAVSWPGCTLDDDRPDKLVEALLAPPRGTWPADRPALFRDAYTGRGVLEKLIETLAAPSRRNPDEPLTPGERAKYREQALDRMQGWLLGPDRNTTCAILMVSRAGESNRAAAVEATYAAAERLGLSRDDVKLGGPTVDGVAIDAECNRSLYVLTALSSLVGLLLAWWFLRSVHLTILVFLTSMLCSWWSLALLHFSGGKLDSVLIMMPALIYVLAISGAIHLLNYYIETVRDEGPEGAALRAVAHCWLPSTLANVTTTIGLGSLVVSDIVPIRKFGLYSAGGVMISLVFLFLFLPAALEWWPFQLLSDKQRAKSTATRPFRRTWPEIVAGFSIRNHGALTALGVAATAVLAIGLTKIETSVKLLNMFKPEARVIQDYTWLETRLGPLVPIEVVLKIPQEFGLPAAPPDSPASAPPRIPAGGSAAMLRRLQLTERVRAEIRSLPEVEATISLATFLPEIPLGRLSGGQLSRRTVLLRKLQNEREQLLASGYLTEEGDFELWRITVRVDALSDTDYAELVTRLRERIDGVLATAVPAGEPPVEDVVCGGISLISFVQATLMDNLVRSFGTAFLLIFCTMMISLKSVWGVVVVMIPNVFPTVVVLGGMGWLGIKVDLGSMMTISVALGMAVDNELHFFTWFRRGLDDGLSRSDALRLAFRCCASAMSQTALICGFGLAVFAFSPFVPTARFGYLMCALLVAALVGDLLVLPAILAGPLGRIYQRRIRKSAPADSPTAARALDAPARPADESSALDVAR